MTLVPPPPSATAEQRVEAFERLHAVSEKIEVTTTCRMGGGGCSQSVEYTLNLANGTQVHHVDDLLPMVPSDSATARAVHGARRAGSRLWLWGGVAIGALVAGFVVADQTENPKLAFVVAGSGILVGAIMGWRTYQQQLDHIEIANESYNADLARRLRVCVNGYIVEACDTPHISNQPP